MRTGIPKIGILDIHKCMNWKSVSFDWNQTRAFLVTAEEGSLSAAARALRLTQPTLGRQVSALENQLGVTLFERVGKSLVLTPSGMELLEHVREMGDAARKVSLAASGRSQAIEGKVCITASDVMAAENLPAFLVSLYQEAPLIEIEVLAENQITDLLRREADIAIRHTEAGQPHLVSRFIGNASAHFYASTSYLEKNGKPETADELQLHGFVGFGDNGRLIAHLQEIGVSLSETNFTHNSASGLVAWQMVRAGLGISIMSDQVGSKYSGMVRLDLDIPPIRFPVWLITHRELYTSRRIHLVFERLETYLKATLV